MKSPNIGHLENDRYCEHDCICGMGMPSRKSVVNENRAHEVSSK